MIVLYKYIHIKNEPSLICFVFRSWFRYFLQLLLITRHISKIITTW